MHHADMTGSSFGLFQLPHYRTCSLTIYAYYSDYSCFARLQIATQSSQSTLRAVLIAYYSEYKVPHYFLHLVFTSCVYMFLSSLFESPEFFARISEWE
jgi:hypothetical protein